MREYGQLQCAFFSHPDIRHLSDQSKLLAIYLIAGPHSNALGCYRLPPGYVSADLGWDLETVSISFIELFENHFTMYDEITEVALIPNFLKWNPISNPNVGINVKKCFEFIPKKFKYFNELVLSLKRFGNHLPKDLETILESFRIPTLPYPIPFPDSEPLPEPFQNHSETIPEASLPPGKAQSPPINVDQLIGNYNVMCVSAGCPEKTEKGRRNERLRNKIRTRIREQPDPQFWQQVFLETVNARQNGSGEWITLDWLVENSNNTMKVYEGNYRRSFSQKDPRSNNSAVARQEQIADAVHQFSGE